MQDITLTPAAITYYQTLLQDKQYLRLSVKKAGCAGLEYRVECVDAPHPDDLPVTDEKAFRCVVCPESLPVLKGTRIDYSKGETLNQGAIVFHNPQAQNACGCGQSFSLAVDPAHEGAQS